jgi:glucose/arabinose dehydrogenase
MTFSGTHQYYNWKFIAFVVLITCISPFLKFDEKAMGQNQGQTSPANMTIQTDRPSLTDRTLKVEAIASGFDFPTSIAFLDKADILLLEKNTGKIYRIIDGNVTAQVIQLNVSFKDERGLLGIAVSGDGNSNKENQTVFLYYTYCPKVKDDKNTSPIKCGNFVYRYKFDNENSKLIEPNLILSLPALPGPSHNGGVLLLDDDQNLYVTIGDLQSTAFNKNQTGYDTRAQNIINGTPPDGRAAILKIDEDGNPVDKGILGSEYPLNLYYAYGIKNSFGIGIDPITGDLWDTENGPQFGDEINLVKPGFNSGWEKIQGVWNLNQTRGRAEVYEDDGDEDMGLEDFNGKGKYSNPEFVWDKTVGPTALVFLDSDKLGEEYENDIYVGSVKHGNIYHFDLDEERKSLSLKGDLADSVLNKKDDTSQVLFGENFGIVTDLKVGPDGNLYIVSGDRGTDEGAIYRIVPN